MKHFFLQGTLLAALACVAASALAVTPVADTGRSSFGALAEMAGSCWSITTQNHMPGWTSPNAAPQPYPAGLCYEFDADQRELRGAYYQCGSLLATAIYRPHTEGVLRMLVRGTWARSDADEYMVVDARSGVVTARGQNRRDVREYDRDDRTWTSVLRRLDADRFENLTTMNSPRFDRYADHRISQRMVFTRASRDEVTATGACTSATSAGTGK